MKNAVETSSEIPAFGKAANHFHSFLSKERKNYEVELESKGFSAETTARHDILQEIWSQIVHWYFGKGRELPIDEAFVDGTIYEVCNQYERNIKAIEIIQIITTNTAHQMISKSMRQYQEAISFCRSVVMSERGRSRLGLVLSGLRFSTAEPVPSDPLQ